MPNRRRREARGRPIRIPDEVAPDGAAQLEPVSRVRVLGQIGRDLPVVDPLDGQFDPRAAGRRRDRIAPWA